MQNPKTEQLPLDLPHDISYALEDYILSASNQDAYDLVTSWPDWPAHAMIIEGPKASGKKHLAHIWALKSGAIFLNTQTLLESDIKHIHSNIVFELAEDQEIDEKVLFHLYNWTREMEINMLLISTVAPKARHIALPDLESRLGSLPIARIDHPDDQLLSILLQKLFSDRQQIVAPNVIEYLIARVERSFGAINRAASEIDRKSLAKKQKISIPLVRECLQDLQRS